MASIGDVFMRLLADDKGFAADVQKKAQVAGDAGAKTLGQRISTGFKTQGVQAFGLAASAAFGIATKGALELENIQVDLQRETGITADEAKRAAKEINGIAGRNVAELGVVRDVFAKVHNDLGLVGDEAVKATEAFVKFGRATAQDAAGAVSAFDDILDAWGLEATDAQGIMDKLVVSHQRYGGSIVENQAALGKLAPQLQALNLDVDDGIGLLNLFAASGLDAGKAQQALNSAITKLPEGESLDEFIARLSTIEDDGERAQAAIEVFGSRGGAGLANAIKPGVDSLDDFAVSAEEAAGATQKASDVIDSSFSGKIRKRISEAQAALRGFGQEFGPALTGMASLASLGAAVFPGLGSKLAGGIAKGFKGFGGLITGFVTDGITFGLDKVPTDPKVAAAQGRVGRFMGSGLGKAFGLAFAGIAIAAVVDTYSRIKAEHDAMLAQIGTDAQNQLKAGSAAALDIQRQALEEGLRQFDAMKASDPVGAWLMGIDEKKAALQAQLDATLGEIAARAAKGGTHAGTVLANGMTASLGQELPKATAAVDRSFGARLFASGREAIGKFADGIRDARQRPLDAFEELKELLKKPLTRTAEVARLTGQLASKELANGMKSQDPYIRARANEIKETILERLRELQKQGAPFGKKAMDELRAGMKSKDPAIRAAANEIYKTVRGELNKTAPAAKEAGKDTGQAFATGVQSAVDRVKRTLAGLAQAFKDYLQVGSPTRLGPLSEGGGIGAWGARLVEELASGVESRRRLMADAVGGVASEFAFPTSPMLPVPSVAAATAGLVGTGRIDVWHHMDEQTGRNLKAAGFDERAVASALADIPGLIRGVRHAVGMRSS